MLRKHNVFFVVVVLFIFSIFLYADVPNLIDYQGRLTDNVGTPLNGNYSITFSIYHVETVGTADWDETQNPVYVDNGLFHVTLGSIDPFPTGLFEDYSELWLGINVEGDGEMSPRTRIVSVAYAQTDGDWVIEGDNVYRVEGSVGIGTTTPSAKLHIDQNTNNPGLILKNVSGYNVNHMEWRGATGGIQGVINQYGDLGVGLSNPGGKFHVKVDDTESIIVTTGAQNLGYVGIGTSIPEFKLDVNGMIRAKGTGTEEDGYLIVEGYQASGNRDPHVSFRDGDGTPLAKIQSFYLNEGTPVNFRLMNFQDGYMSFHTNGEANERMRITNNGDVGINTTIPDAKLHILQDSNKKGLILQNTAEITSANHMEWQGATGGIQGVINQYGDIGVGLSNPGGKFHVKVDDTESIIVTTGAQNLGYVGIGTTTPARKLHVNDCMRLEPISDPPDVPSAGDLYFDSDDNKLKCYDGTTWQNCF